MRQLFHSGAASIVLALAGCSHIPDPGSVPGVEPYHILQNIRCEIAGVLLNEYPFDDPFYDWVREADIAYGLTLRAEEKSNNSGSITWLWPIHLGTFSLNLSGGKEKERHGENEVIIAEELNRTLKLVEEDAPVLPGQKKAFDPVPCKPPLHTIAYPILGSIGMSDIIRRFVEVNTIAPTAKFPAPADDPFYATAAGDGKFVHTLKFTLKFSGGVKPSFEIKRLDGRQLSGNADINGSRLDYHQLIIAMAPPTLDELAKAKAERAAKSRREKGARGKRPYTYWEERPRARVYRGRSVDRTNRQRSLIDEVARQQYFQKLPFLAPLR